MRLPLKPAQPGHEQQRRNCVTADVQMNNTQKSFELPNLAALLDGEIRDEQRLAELANELGQSGSLKAEFDEQRQVKSLLGGLPEYEAPAFLATRVIGEIAARRKLHRSHRLKPWLAAAGGFVACLALVGLLFTPVSPLRHALPGQPMLAREVTAPTPAGVLAMDNEYLQGSWNSEMTVPVVDGEELDPQVKQFLEFVNEAHGYRVMMRQGTALSPDLPEAMLVLGEQQPAAEH
jgi:hypothetical protein